MVNLEQTDWAMISYEELDMILRQLDEDLNLELSNGLTPLCLACKNRREDLVTVLLHHGAQISKQCSVSMKQALHFACDNSNGNLGVVRKLLQGKADVNAVDEDGNTALHLACRESNVPVAELLIKSGADVSMADVDGETPLIRGCRAENIELIKMLLKAGSDPNAGKGAAMDIAILNSSNDMMELLLQAGVNLNEGSYLSQACEHDSLEKMKILYEHGINLNRRDSLGKTPLQTACLSQTASLACVHLLLQWGASADVVSSTGGSAVSYAAIDQNISKVRLLMAYSTNINVCNMYFLSLILTFFKKLSVPRICVQILELLLAAGLRLTLDNSERMKATVGYVHDSPVKTELLNLLKDHRSIPLSLQSLCRISLRTHIKPNKDHNIHTLPLPLHVKQFLNFCDYVKEPDI